MDSIKADVTGAADQGGTGLMKASSPVSRRAVVATGVAAAWTIPVIQLATAAPALAASTVTPPTLTISGTGQWRSTGKNTWVLDTTFTVTNSGTVATSGLSVTFTFPPHTPTWQPTASTPNGWAVSGNGSSTITFTADPAHQLAGGKQTLVASTLTPKTPSNMDIAVTIKIAATDTTTGAANGSSTIDVAKV